MPKALALGWRWAVQGTHVCDFSDSSQKPCLMGVSAPISLMRLMHCSVEQPVYSAWRCFHVEKPPAL